MSRSVRPELSDLLEELHDVKKKWYGIGIQLKVSDARLDEIESTAKDDLERAFRLMIKEWLKQIEPEPTWAGIVKVLRSRSVDEQSLADYLEGTFCTPSAASSATPHDAADITAVTTWNAIAASGSAQVMDPAVRREMGELYELFEKLRSDVYTFLRKEPPDLDDFCALVTFSPPAWKMKQQRPLTGVDLDRILRSDKLGMICFVLSQYINWYNYELLKSIVEKYADPPIKQQMEGYRTRLDEFEKRTNLDAVKNIPLCQPDQNSVAFIVKMPNHQSNQFHLYEIRKMQHGLADEAGIDHAAVRTHNAMVIQTSVKIIFLVPFTLAPYLVVSFVCPLLSSQEPLPENMYDRCVHVVETEEAFRLMGRPLPPPRPALPAPPYQRSSFSLSSSYSDEPRPKPTSALNPQPTLDPHHVQVFHNKVLDADAYTVVCKARLSHLPCVAKYVHPKLVKSHERPVERFLEGCHFLESCHHPNIITFLGTHYDDSLKVTVLLMEKMEQSLQHYLEHAAHPVPIHTQLDICHDIAQGLEYIHSRGYIHGDLTATNILLQGRRAKIGGMMTLQCKSPDADLSLCSGTPAYMPMRSFSSSDYDESIDCFSFGVVAIYIATGEMPSPPSYTEEVSGEIERYSKSIAKVDSGHPMHPIILQCLKDQSMERPSAANLCKELLALKENEVYKTSLKSEVQLLSMQNERLQEERKAIRQEIFADARKEIESIMDQAKAEKERMEASFRKEKEQVRSEAERDIQRATKEKISLEQDLKSEIHRLTTACEKVEKEREEWKTKSKKGEMMFKEQSHNLSAIIEEQDKLQRDMQERNEDLGKKLKDLLSSISYQPL